MSVIRDRSVIFSIQQYVIKFVSDSRQVGDFLYTTVCDKVCQWFATGRWFSPCTQASSTSKTYRHKITEILLKVALSAIPLNPIHKPSNSKKRLERDKHVLQIRQEFSEYTSWKAIKAQLYNSVTTCVWKNRHHRQKIIKPNKL